MNGRERVGAALRFSHPDHVPRDLWPLPYVKLFRQDELDAVLDRFPSDIGWAEPAPNSGADELENVARRGTYADEWGSIWHVGEPGVVGEVKQPALADWSALRHFHPPWDLLRRRNLGHANRQCDQSDRFMLSPSAARPFERLQFLRGTENLLMDLAYGGKEVRRLIEMVHEFYLADVESWCRSNVDAVFFMDDWGSNRSLLIHPELWRAVFKPLYRDYCDRIHQAGKFAFFHSDGHIEAIYGDLIQIGIDALNSQLFRMDIEGLAEKYRGRVTFWGEIDRQRILPFGSPGDVREAVRRVRRALDDGRGGLIAQCEWGKDNPRRNIEAVFEAWME